METMPTQRLYYEDAYLQQFTAVVTSCEAQKDGYAITLDRTAFYPEAADTCGPRHAWRRQGVGCQEKDGNCCTPRTIRLRWEQAWKERSTGRGAFCLCSSIPGSISSPGSRIACSIWTMWGSTWGRRPLRSILMGSSLRSRWPRWNVWPTKQFTKICRSWRNARPKRSWRRSITAAKRS